MTIPWSINTPNSGHTLNDWSRLWSPITKKKKQWWICLSLYIRAASTFTNSVNHRQRQSSTIQPATQTPTHCSPSAESWPKQLRPDNCCWYVIHKRNTDRQELLQITTNQSSPWAILMICESKQRSEHNFLHETVNIEQKLQQRNKSKSGQQASTVINDSTVVSLNWSRQCAPNTWHSYIRSCDCSQDRKQAGTMWCWDNRATCVPPPTQKPTRPRADQTHRHKERIERRAHRTDSRSGQLKTLADWQMMTWTPFVSWRSCFGQAPHDSHRASAERPPT